MSRRIITRIVFTAIFLAVIAFKAGLVLAVGQMPVPTLNNVSVRATASFDPTAIRYSYNYTVQNPGSNTGEIWNIKIDIRQNPRVSGGLPASGLTIPFGTAVIPFFDMLRDREPLDLPPGVSLVPIGQQAPPGWHGGFGKDGYARFSAGSGGTKILPGNTMSGFTMISRGVPTIREIQLIPDWVLIVEDHDAVTDEQLEQAAIVEKNLPLTLYTLGPSSLVTFGSDDHWTQLAADIQRAANLGWITDSGLAQSLQTQLSFARQALDQNDGTLAKTRLQTVRQTLQNSTAGQRNQEIFDLVTLNVQELISNTPDTPIPFEPVYSLTPSTATHAVGIEHTLTAKVVNAADHDAPVPNSPVSISIVDGPHASMSWSGRTDANGEFAVKYVGTKVGTDHIVWMGEIPADLNRVKPKPVQLAALGSDFAAMLVALQRFPGALAEATVTWSGGPDLVVPFFMPPMIISRGGNPVFVTEVTQNIGILEAPASTTRYYLSNTLPINPSTARVIGERRVPLLLPGESSDQNTLRFQLPNDLAAGNYYIAACADADREIAELDEDNNCSFNKLTTSVSKVVPALEVTNTPPDCSQASPSVATIWPPNHKLVNVTINGVTDPDNDTVSIRITRIRQDEPVNGLGDGDTSPDGFGIGTTTAQVRAERSGLGNGRVYEIGFAADDGQGGSCQGVVSVGVPHDHGGQAVPVNDGAIYDSTVP